MAGKLDAHGLVDGMSEKATGVGMRAAASRRAGGHLLKHCEPRQGQQQRQQRRQQQAPPRSRKGKAIASRAPHP
jgi:hypothetical protein